MELLQQHVTTFFFLSMEFAKQNVSTLFLLSGIAFFILFVLGTTNALIIFRDRGDFFWSVLIVVSPAITWIALRIAEPSQSPADYNLLWGTLNAKILTILGGGATGWAVIKTFQHCLQNNGVFLGSVVFVFKVLASIVLVILILGVVMQPLLVVFKSKNVSATPYVILGVILFGIFAFFANRLINGARVLEKA